ncbi:hypothetical protein [Streptomyces cucumeris]|nr:hypothetical protein [Streptomyces sp. NEAU-Y11]
MGATVYRRRLQELSARIAGHPFWDCPSGTPAAPMALKEHARRQAEQ